MKKAVISLLAFTFGTFAMLGQVSASRERFSPLVPGYIERARAMSGAGNYEGVIDQLRHLDTQQLSLNADYAREYTYLLADAYYQRGDAECVRLLMQFRNAYPASPMAPKASLAIADFYFFRHDWAEALNAYYKCDFDRLNRDEKPLYTYRRALCLIKTGHFREAGPEVAKLKGAKGYGNVYNFYNAYLNYIDGDFRKAYAGFEKVPEGIDGLDAGYYMAQIEYSRGEYEKVISRGTSLMRNNPDPELAPEIDRIVGLSYFKRGNNDQVRRYLTDYLSTTQGSPDAEALYAMGAIDYEDGRYNSAIERLSQLTDDPGSIGQGAWLYLGQCYLKQDNPSSAAMAFEKAMRLDYDHKVSETALYNYVTALTRGGKVPFSSSSELLESFVSKYPDSEYAADVEKYLATAYYNDRNYKKALRYVESIKHPGADIQEAKQKILYELGIECLTNGQAEQAAGYLRECAAMQRCNRALASQASLWLGDALFSLGRYKEAAKSYESFVSDSTNRDNLALGYYDLAYAQYKTGEYAKAARNFNQALSVKPELDTRLVDDARIRMADCLYYTGKYAEASVAYTKAVNDGAGDADYALYRRAVLNGLAGNTKAKLSDLQTIELNYPNSRWMDKVLLEKAVTYEETGQSALAADAYKKRLQLTGEAGIDELLRMASAMNDASRWEDLLEVVGRIRRAGGLEPDELAEIDLYEADALAGTGRIREAEPIYSRLAEVPSSLPGAKSSVILAEIEIGRGEYEAARVRLEEFTDVGSPHQYWLARAFLSLADAYHGLGDTHLAKEYVSSLKDNYPGGEPDIQAGISERMKKWK